MKLTCQIAVLHAGVTLVPEKSCCLEKKKGAVAEMSIADVSFRSVKIASVRPSGLSVKVVAGISLLDMMKLLPTN